MDVEEVKLEVYIPESHLTQLLEALHEAGAGRVGDYDHCMSVTRVTGYWRPLAGADPYQGEVGELEQGSECKVEMRCPVSRLAEALAAVRRVHPYEEPVVNAVPLLGLEPEATSPL